MSHRLLMRAIPALALLPVLIAAGSGQQRPSDVEKGLFDSVNRERAERKLSTLKWNDALARAARKHAEVMAEQDVLAHRLPGEADLVARARDAGVSFSHITENIGMAVYASSFHDGWMHSPGHRANILDPEVDSVGIAVADGGEHLYAVEDFARAVTVVSFEEQKKRVERLLALRGLRIVDIGPAAEQSCELDHDYVGGSKPKYVAHYETPDISQLPDSVLKDVRAAPYKSAAVGACAPKDSTAFAAFRIVILLYR